MSSTTVVIVPLHQFAPVAVGRKVGKVPLGPADKEGKRLSLAHKAVCVQAEYDGGCTAAPLRGDLKDSNKGNPFNA